MNARRAGATFRLGAAEAEATPEGAMLFCDSRTLVVADLHLGRSERMARLGGAFLPPYETVETLNRLEALIARVAPRRLVSLGDSFDDDRAARALEPEIAARIARLTATADWTWIAGNHDPSPPRGLGGGVAAEIEVEGVALRHIARADLHGPEASGHYHPKAVLCAHGRRLRRRCLLTDGLRAILPAFGLYTGGLDALDAAFDPLLRPTAVAFLIPPDPTGAVHATPRTRLARR